MEDKLEDKPKIDEKLAKTIGQVSTTHSPLFFEPMVAVRNFLYTVPYLISGWMPDIQLAKRPALRSNMQLGYKQRP